MLRKPARFEYDTKWETLLKEPTVELARLIVEASDRVALEVLLETRRLFRLGEEPLLLLPDFLMKICDRMPSWKGFDTVTAGSLTALTI
jgi:hypothetical protein